MVAWLAAGDTRLVLAGLGERLNAEEIAISPMVELELAYLHEIGRITAGPEPILAELRRSIDLTVDQAPLAMVVGIAATAAYAFTRDPFDRLVGAQAAAAGADLATKDRVLQSSLDFVVWD